MASIKSREKFSGITMIEVIVVIAVTSVLMLLVSTAILRSRESARRVTCQSRMHQIGVAVGNCESRTGCYPQHHPQTSRNLGWLALLMADMGHANLQRDLSEIGSSTEFSIRQLHVPSELQCPSDPRSIEKWLVNFAMNAGSRLSSYEDDYPDLVLTNGFGADLISSKDVTDGLSNTVYASERLNEPANRRDRRARWKTPVAYVEPTELDQFADLCATMPTGSIGIGHWSDADLYSQCKYDHVMTPNQPSCQNEEFDLRYSTYAASSEHAGGVNVLFADGSIRFVSDSVARRIWRAWGTRDGNEVVGSE